MRSQHLFTGDEWLWADSAYALDSWCVTPFKKPLSTIPDNAKFNYHLSRVRCFYRLRKYIMLTVVINKVRVKSEHAMGYFKGRFCSMRGLRQQIDDARDHERAVAWIKACIVIHTLIFFIEHGHKDWEYIAELVEEGTDTVPDGVGHSDLESEVVRETKGQRKREVLKNELFEYLYDE